VILVIVAFFDPIPLPVTDVRFPSARGVSKANRTGSEKKASTAFNPYSWPFIANMSG